ncbi:phage resistance protein, partial [Staphylococcus simulans]
LKVLKEQGFILAGDETLQRLIQEDYKSMRYKKAKEDMKKIGISLNKQNKIEGVNYKVHEIGNQELFDMAYKLLE